MNDVNQSLSISYVDHPKPPNRHPADRYCEWGGWMHTRDYGRSFNEVRFRPHEVDDLIEAEQFAARIGKPINTAITLMWCLTASGETDIQARWRKFHNAFRQWLRRQGYEWTAIWQHENPPNKGFNTHLSINLPTHMHAAIYKWLSEYFGGDANAIDVRPGSLVRYGCKGTDKITADRHGLRGKNGRRKFNQGIIQFKRGGCSANINRTARQKFTQDYLAKYATRVRKA